MLLKPLPLLTLYIYYVYCFNKQLEFIYPMGDAQIPKTSNITTKLITYTFEEAKFDQHKLAFKKIKKMLTEGPVFSNQLAIPVYQLTKTSLQLLDESALILDELTQLAAEDYSYGVEPPLTTNSVELIRTSWFHDTDFNDLRILAGHLEADKDYDFTGASDSSPQEQKIVNNMVLFHGELTKYNNDLAMLLQLFSSLRNQKITEDVEQILRDQIFQGLYLENKISSNYFRVKEKKISFQIQATVYSEIELATRHKSIPYFGQKIAGQYYSDPAGTRVYAIECKNDICAEKHPDPCGESIFHHDLSGILFNCTFVEDDTEFEITPKGIFIYKKPSAELQELLDSKDISADKRPTLVQFTGCYHLPKGNTTIHGCLNLATKQITPRFDIGLIENYFDPYFLIKIFKYLKDLPFLSLLLILPTSVILVLWSFKALCGKICCSKPTYQKTPIYDRTSRRSSITRKRRLPRQSL